MWWNNDFHRPGDYFREVKNVSRRKYLESEETQVASATECTGLMPSLPQDESEDEHSAKLYGIHMAKQKKRP